MTNLYVATRILTFFGSMMRAFWEHVACRICGVPIEDARVFKVSELCGHIEHELITNKKHSFLVCWLPFTMNFIFSCCFLLSGAYRIAYIGDYVSVTSWVFLWLGISFAANCIPSFEDVLCFGEAFYNVGTKLIIKILVAPFYAIIYGFGVLERYSITLVISVVYAIVFPQIVNVFFPIVTTISQMLS